MPLPFLLPHGNGIVRARIHANATIDAEVGINMSYRINRDGLLSAFVLTYTGCHALPLASFRRWMFDFSNSIRLLEFLSTNKCPPPGFHRWQDGTARASKNGDTGLENPFCGDDHPQEERLQHKSDPTPTFPAKRP